MAIFKRFEVWLLLFIIGGALWFVFQPPKDDPVDEPAVVENPQKPDPIPKKTEDPNVVETPNSKPKTDRKSEKPEPKVATPVSTDRFEIQKASVVSENGGKVVEISILGRNEKSLNLAEPNARLVTEDGDQLDRFFLPFDPAPVLEGADSVADLKYWVQGELKAEKLWLEIDGERVAVDLEKQ